MRADMFEEHSGAEVIPEVKGVAAKGESGHYYVPPYHVEDTSRAHELSAIQEGLKASSEVVGNHVFTSPGCEKRTQAARDRYRSCVTCRCGGRPLNQSSEKPKIWDPRMRSQRSCHQGPSTLRNHFFCQRIK